MRWQLILEEFSAEPIYIKGSKNIAADALSSLDNMNNVNKKNKDKLIQL